MIFEYFSYILARKYEHLHANKEIITKASP
jgi:hypothetical protein